MVRIIIATLVVIVCSNLVNAEPKVPCHFIFGDSLSDAGNNNQLTTAGKSNYPPYGVDFPGGIATGRYTNGLTIADFITQFLGFKRLITPYSSQMDQDILLGVNFASGGAGILNETASQGYRTSMDQQLQNYVITTSKLKTMVEGPVSNYLRKCLHTVNIGSNDYILNYFMPLLSPSKKLFNYDQFATLLITRYKSQLQTLYKYGARKMAIYGLGRIDCTPVEKALNNATQCVEEIKQAVDIFNNKLVSLVDDLNTNLADAKFTFIDFSAILEANPLPIGSFRNSTCCKVSIDFLCKPFTKPCLQRYRYGYFDGIHPTEVVNKKVAKFSYNSPSHMFVHPKDINQLVSD